MPLRISFLVKIECKPWRLGGRERGREGQGRREEERVAGRRDGQDEAMNYTECKTGATIPQKVEWIKGRDAKGGSEKVRWRGMEEVERRRRLTCSGHR